MEIFPALAGNPLVEADDPTDVTLAILYGGREMSAHKDFLTAEQIAAVVSYSRTSFGNDAEPVTVEFVEQLWATVDKSALPSTPPPAGHQPGSLDTAATRPGLSPDRQG